MSSESVEQECPASVSDQSVQEAISFKSVKKSVKQECPTRISHKSVLQGCPIQKFSKTWEHSGLWVLSVFLKFVLFGNGASLKRDMNHFLCGSLAFVR